jgi:chemotaxis protein histidine kinase CheA
MAKAPQPRGDHPIEFPAGDGQPINEQAAEAESMRVQFEKARRLVAMELELAEMRCQVAESSLKLTEAQLELAERQIEQLKAENERLQQERDALQLQRAPRT